MLMLPLAVDPQCTVVRVRYEGTIDPLPFAVFPSADGSITLTPHDATLEGPSIRVERVGVIGDVTHNIGYWLDPAATATWPVAIGAGDAGTYRVQAELACADPAAGSMIRLQAGSSTTSPDVAVPPTGGWQSYRSVDLGSIALSSGSHGLVLRASTKAGEAVANVRSIRLVRSP